jgi:hypothetical protein
MVDTFRPLDLGEAGTLVQCLADAGAVEGREHVQRAQRGLLTAAEAEREAVHPAIRRRHVHRERLPLGGQPCPPVLGLRHRGDPGQGVVRHQAGVRSVPAQCVQAADPVNVVDGGAADRP